MKDLIISLSRGIGIGMFYATAHYLHQVGLNGGAGFVLSLSLALTALWVVMPIKE
jgi:uncharacterized membrane protein (UPF0136 family)